MFEDQNVELLPARTVMGGFSFTSNRARGGNGGTAVAVNALNLYLLSGNGTGNNNGAIADASGGNARAGG